MTAREIISQERHVENGRVKWHLTLSCGHILIVGSGDNRSRKIRRCALCPKPVKTSDRNLEIINARRSGSSYVEIAARLGVSPERVRQIYGSLNRSL